MTPLYSREAHAAHYQGGGGHDLEKWDYTGWEPPTHIGRPPGTEFAHGYIDPHGVKHWVYTRRAPLSNVYCSRCAHV